MPAHPSYTQPAALLARQEVTRLEGEQAVRGLRVAGYVGPIVLEPGAHPGLYRVVFANDQALWQRPTCPNAAAERLAQTFAAGEGVLNS